MGRPQSTDNSLRFTVNCRLWSVDSYPTFSKPHALILSILKSAVNFFKSSYPHHHHTILLPSFLKLNIESEIVCFLLRIIPALAGGILRIHIFDVGKG